MATRADPKEPVAVRVHPINVGQGDAILLEIQYAGGKCNDCVVPKCTFRVAYIQMSWKCMCMQ